MEASFHAEYKIDNLAAVVRSRTWRWLIVRIAGLSPESPFMHALYPVDPDTGERSRRVVVPVIDDPDAVDAFFARQGASA